MATSTRLFAIVTAVVMCTAAVPAQAPGTSRVMRQKLGHSQQILAAILESNFRTLERETTALKAVTADPAWTVLKGPEYLRQSEAFLKVLGELDAAAKERDLDAAAERYTELTMTCFRCHRYMKDRRLAR
jgi:hypothetical protein